MERVMIESPFAAKTDDGKSRNLDYAFKAVEDSIMRGEAPFASHLFYPRWLSDEDREQRELGISLGQTWMVAADKVVFYTDYGWSAGMERALNLAMMSNIPTEIRSLEQ